MKRLCCVALTAAMLMIPMPTVSAVGTSASAAILMEAESGRVLYEHNIHEPRLIASITKLMTALVALESGKPLDEIVTIRPEWTGIEGSSIYLRPGEKVTLETLLYGMLLRSGNDAAIAVAGCCADSAEAFVARMNEKAMQLGMTNSHFANPNGLNASGHYSSAYDMALLARACLANEALAQIVSTRSVALGERSFTNHNKLLWQYEGCVGLKTGYTEKAGRTLVSAAKRDGMTLICVTLNDPNDWADHKALFDYGFSTYRMEAQEEAGEPVCRLPVRDSLLPFCPVAAENNICLPLTQGECVTRELHLEQQTIQAPTPAGTRAGEAVYLLNGEELARTALVTCIPVKKEVASPQGLWEGLQRRLDELSGK